MPLLFSSVVLPSGLDRIWRAVEESNADLPFLVISRRYMPFVGIFTEYRRRSDSTWAVAQFTSGGQSFRFTIDALDDASDSDIQALYLLEAETVKYLEAMCRSYLTGLPLAPLEQELQEIGPSSETSAPSDIQVSELSNIVHLFSKPRKP